MARLRDGDQIVRSCTHNSTVAGRAISSVHPSGVWTTAYARPMYGTARTGVIVLPRSRYGVRSAVALLSPLVVTTTSPRRWV